MPVLIHTNLDSSIKVEQVEESQEGVVLMPFKPNGLRCPVVVGSIVLGWPLFCVNASFGENLSFLTLSVPILGHKNRPIDVQLEGFPQSQSSGQDFWLSSTMYFSVGMVSVTLPKGAIIVLLADPIFDQRSQEAIQISAMFEPDGTLRLASHCAMHLLNRKSTVEDEVRGHLAFFSVAWRQGELPQVQIRPDMFPEPVGRNRNAEALVAAIPDPLGEGLVICYAGKAGWLSKVIRLNREPKESRWGRAS